MCLGLEWWDDVMSVRVVSLNSLYRCQVQVSVYCASRIPAHHRCTCFTLLISASYRVFVYFRYRKSIFLCVCCCRTWICIDITRLYPAGPHGRLAQKTVNRAPIAGAGGFDTICTADFKNCCDRSTTCRRCRLEP